MTVRHARGEYEVSLSTLAQALGGLADARIVTDRNVAQFWIPDSPHPVFRISPGESSKSLSSYDKVLQFLSDSGACRTSAVVALGGGVVGDLAGFAAATFMRGVPFFQIPTSLLAMVDSSVGGKVGINLPQGKNLVGAFYPPEAVFVCLETLETLPEREFNAGAAEILKIAAALDWDFFEALERKPLHPGDERMTQVVMRSVDLKRRVVETDEFETSGMRSVLNFGHTVGHALETVTDYGVLLHGEAVSIGMVVEACLGEKLDLTPTGTAVRLSRALVAQNLPVKVPEVNLAHILATMHRDKKAKGRDLSLALLTGHGSCKLVHDVPDYLVLECLQDNL